MQRNRKIIANELRQTTKAIFLQINIKTLINVLK